MDISITQALISLTAGGTGLGALIFFLVRVLGHLDKKDEVFTGTIKEINDRNLEHHTRLSLEASERSQAVQACITSNNQLIGRACSTLDRHDAILREYEIQSRTRAET